MSVLGSTGAPLSMPASAATSCYVVSPSTGHWTCAGGRVGEASNPGPTLLRVGTTNPTGIRGKEQHVIDHGPGIWHFSETQLSQITQQSSRATLQCLGRRANRHVRIHTGAPAPLRPGSSWAGAWSGVLTMSDFPSVSLGLPWPDGAFQTGRVSVTQHAVGSLSMVSANVYGYCSGPTHPDSTARTNRPLTTLTEELVLGKTGVRIIAGDFNQDPANLEQVSLWLQQGWVECQSLAQRLWGRTPQPTCKHATQRDLVFLSPEAASLCREVYVEEVFQEHSSVSVDLAFDSEAPTLLRWPMPSLIPWNHVARESWQASYVPSPEAANPTQWLQQFGRHYEDSLSQHVHGLPGNSLPKSLFGRARHVQPVQQKVPALPPRPSRPGEEEVRHSLLCAEVNHWFRQLRRLQSMRHAVVAGKATAAAVEYRAALWRSILHARGFSSTFPEWWTTRLTRLQGSPRCIPQAIPTAATVDQIFLDFRENFRRYEAWHIRQRQAVLKSRHEKSRNMLFQELRESLSSDAPAGQVDSLTVRRTYSILEVDDAGNMAQVEPQPDLRGHSTPSLSQSNL